MIRHVNNPCRIAGSQGAAGFSPREASGPQFAPYAYRAFSLIEIMIATIILGFGLLMIGAVLPIAWKGSVQSSELTRAEGASRTAKYLVQKKCRVDGLRDLFDPNQDPLQPPDGVSDSPDPPGQPASYSFLGDLDTPDPDFDGDLIPDPLVHALHLENWAMDPAALFVCNGNTVNDLSVPEAPILIETALADTRVAGIPADLLAVGVCTNYPGRIGAPVIELRDRLYPPLPATLTPEDVSQWRELLGSRRFAWAVFHRLARVPQSPTDPRYFHMYYATLRRGNTTSRFARQDSSVGLVGVQPGAVPQAMAASEDVMFPIAWRVPLLVVESQSPGVPAIAFAGAVDADVNDFLAAGLPTPLNAAAPIFPVNNSVCRVADMFPRGSFFIDELNGNVYRVSQREYIDNAAGQTNRLARLTLDLEVTIADLQAPLVGGPFTGTERNRVVWVFPPSAAAGTRNPVNFTGANPVIDIRVETLTLMP